MFQFLDFLRLVAVEDAHHVRKEFAQQVGFGVAENSAAKAGHGVAKATLRLKDLLTLQAKLITIENIQKTVADYYKVRVADLLSKRRSRSIARPRQVAMALAKELTTHSLPEIGDAFGGRDHTTVLHACGRIRELRAAEQRVGEDYQNLLRTLTG